MNRTSKSRSFLPVKAVLIIITVTASTGGFILGYFVGKGVSSPNVIPLIKQPVNDAVSAAPAPNPNPDSRNEPSSPAGTAGQTPSTENKQTSATPISHEALPSKAEIKEEGNVESGKDVSSESAVESEKKAVYTVQAGAFKRQKDADVLKKNLEGKGFTASIKKDSNSKGMKLFKVRTGEFENKKEAAAFALKLKKEFGLNSFATIKK